MCPFSVPVSNDAAIMQSAIPFCACSHLISIYVYSEPPMRQVLHGMKHCMHNMLKVTSWYHSNFFDKGNKHKFVWHFYKFTTTSFQTLKLCSSTGFLPIPIHQQCCNPMREQYTQSPVIDERF